MSFVGYARRRELCVSEIDIFVLPVEVCLFLGYVGRRELYISVKKHIYYLFFFSSFVFLLFLSGSVFFSGTPGGESFT